MSADLKTSRVHRLASVILALATAAIGSVAAAQTAQGPQAPEHYTLDANGVDVVRGTFNHSATDVRIGPDDLGLAYTRTYAGEVHRGNFDGLIEVEITGEAGPSQYIWTYTVSVGGESENYTAVSGTTPGEMSSQSANGSTLQFDGTKYIHIDRAGVVRTFDPLLADAPTWGVGTPPAGPGGRIVKLEKPTGERSDWFYRSTTYSGLTVRRIQSVTNTRGYQIKFEYAFNGAPASSSQLTEFSTLSRVTGINNAIDYCDPNADACSSLSQAWPTSTYSGVPSGSPWRIDVTDATSATIGYVFDAGFDGGLLREIDWATPGRASTTITYGAFNQVSSVSDGRGTWNYAYTINPSFPNTQVTTVTDPNSNTTTYHARLRTGPPGAEIEQQRLTRITDALGNITYTQYDGNGRLTQVTYPESNTLQYTRDSRGNVTQVRQTAKPSAPATDIVQSWTYASTCVNRVTCNLPTAWTDARGAVTDYDYDGTHGGMLSETKPAPTPGAARPQTRYGYTQLSAWYRMSSSTTRTAGPAMWLPSWTSSCATASPTVGCAGTADEVRTAITYLLSPGGSNLTPWEVITRSGDSLLEAVTTTEWTSWGDPLTVDGPLVGTADTTWYAYDAVRRRVGEIRPDPDGGGARLYPATRTAYNADGQPVSVELGTTTGQSSGAWAAFSPLQTATTQYDAQGRKALDIAFAGSVNPQVTQYAYDNEGRATCVAVRMNPATFSGLPASACTHAATGSWGPDRITLNGYDAADRLTSVIEAYGAAEQRTALSQAWTANSKVDWVQDANNNRSDYAYDGFDRQTHLYFPLPTTGSQAANSADYEQYGYDPNANPTTKRVRSGETFTTTFDALNRVIYIDAPAGTQDAAFTYDNLDRRLTASQPGGQTITSAWDALGRNTSEAGPLGTMSFQYDLAGRRTKRTWPNGNYVDYGWDLSNAMTSAAVNGWMTAGAFTYDNLGRRLTTTRYSGVTTSYGYNTASQLISLSHDLTGSANDVSYTYSYSPAPQIAGRTVSNSVYDYSPASVWASYVNNGLNQSTAAGGVTVTWDGRGNLTSDGARSYTYDAANRLLSGGGSSLSYDPLDRLYQMTGTGAGRFLYDGSQLAGVFDGAGTMFEHYVGGPNPDEWLALHDGGQWYWPLQDAQGSVIALTVSSGAATSTLAYDEYGQPRSGNLGRMQYTGQMILPDAGLQHYKARAYHAGLGRFVQTDPVGYEQGLNLYAYVESDPVNFTDPTGLRMAQDPGETDPTSSCAADRPIAECDELQRRLEEATELDPIVVDGPPPSVRPHIGLAWGSFQLFILGQPVIQKIVVPLPYIYFSQSSGGSPPNTGGGRQHGRMPGPQGAERWARNRGMGSAEGRRRFHEIKRRDTGSQARDEYSVDANSGDVYDPQGEWVGNLSDPY